MKHKAQHFDLSQHSELELQKQLNEVYREMAAQPLSRNIPRYLLDEEKQLRDELDRRKKEAKQDG